MAEPAEFLCGDLDEAIDTHKGRGYRLDMIFPADSPREALISKDGELIKLTRSGGTGGLTFGKSSEVHEATEWATGRAGMEYRDLIPGRLGGKVIASHIRLPFGGEVPDSVHYHKIDFQMIYCVRGRIQVVYEDQGPPFWLETGDCILQPPQIRHRVLYSEAGAEVIEVSSPAEHETWIDHVMELPTPNIDRDRLFGGQKFIHSRAENAEWQPLAGEGILIRDTGILEASGRLFDVRVFRNPKEMGKPASFGIDRAGPKGFTHPVGPGETLVVDFYLNEGN